MNDQATLHAGGIVPANSKLGKDDVVDAVVARAYAHPVLPGRTIVRLCAEGVTAGDELEMSTLGFAAGEDRGTVGKERKRPLGFPGWCLVNDPKNARYALDVVKELKKHARKAKSTPGHAKDAFDAIAARLARTVPHFLPSFYEEVGRVFIEHGAINYAAQMFGKARQVESVHALEVDEQHRIDGFLEFALAGAVTTKALSEYGKDLSNHHEPKAAYAHFRQLCVQRTLGGMPPWSGMAKDLSRLAKAGKLDVAKEDAALIGEIIESPALAKAAGEFWRAYAEPITTLGKSSPAVRGVLLNLFPTGTSTNANAELDDAWLDLLEATGAIEAVIGEAPAEAQPANGRAAWFDKVCNHVSRGWRSQTIPPRVFALLRRMAPALIADGKPIKGSGRSRVDLDLAELALELGISVEPIEHWVGDGSQWASSMALAEHGRDPVHVAAHPKLGAVLQAVVATSIGGEAFDVATRGKTGFLQAKRQWLEGILASAEAGGLPALEAALTLIDNKAKAGTFAELSDLHPRLAALDVAPALARTLQVGLLDELGWPALEAVIQELRPDGTGPLPVLYGAPSALVVATATKAIAIVGDQRKAEHDLVVPPKHEVCAIRYIGDQFLVVLKEGYAKVRAYWSSAPQDHFEVADVNVWSISPISSSAVTLSDGAWFEGNRPIRPGDRVLPFTNKIIATDGSVGWIPDNSGGQQRWRELSMAGELGRHSWPAWIEAFAADGWRLEACSRYLPCHVSTSPLGVAEGFAGVRIRSRNVDGKHQRAIETIDGATVTVRTAAIDLLRFPDGGARRPVDQEYAYGEHPAVLIYDPTGTFVGSKIWGGDPRYARGQGAATQVAFLHNYVARDVAGSKRLHAVTVEDARALLAAAPVIDASTKPATTPKSTGTIPEVELPEDLPGQLPEITHPALRKGLTGIAIMAKQFEARRDKLVAEREPGNASAVVAAGPSDKPMLEMLGGWGRTQYAAEGSGWAQIARVGDQLAAEDRSDRVIKDLGVSTFDWNEVAALPSSLVFLALAIGTPADKRILAVELYEHLLQTLPPAGKLRVLRVHGELAGEESTKVREFQVRWVGGNAYVIRPWGYSGNHYHIVEYAPTGEFKPMIGMIIDGELRGVTGVPAAELREAVTAGKTSWNPAVVERLATATGLTPSEATYLWAGCPGANDRGANFLDKELRETLDLKAAQAELARDALRIPRYHTKLATIAEAGNAGVAALLDGSAVDVLAAAWVKRYGQRIAIPEALIEKANAQDLSHNVPIVMGWLLDDESPQLTVDGHYGFDAKGVLVPVASPEPLVGQTKLEDASPHFDLPTVKMLVLYLPFLYAELPVGDPVRALAVKAYRLTLERLASPSLWLNAGNVWLEKEKLDAIEKQIEGLGGEILADLGEGRIVRRLRGGVVQRLGQSIAIAVRPAELDAKARTVMDPLMQQVNAYVTTGRDLSFLMGTELAAMLARITDTPVPAGGWEQNPLLSVPKLVDKVIKAKKLSREAAALYLQYLVLLRPTAKNLAEYSAWSPKQIAAAQQELVDHELLLEAKRERAGRRHFLPGGWEAYKAPIPPNESWKIAMYPHSKVLAQQPFHTLFERAWKRIEDGDEPRYEEVKR